MVVAGSSWRLATSSLASRPRRDLERAGRNDWPTAAAPAGRDELLDDRRLGAVAERDEVRDISARSGAPARPAEDDRTPEPDAGGNVEEDALVPAARGRAAAKLIVGREAAAAARRPRMPVGPASGGRANVVELDAGGASPRGRGRVRTPSSSMTEQAVGTVGQVDRDAARSRRRAEYGRLAQLAPRRST